MKIDTETKVAFIAQYWGQNIMKIREFSFENKVKFLTHFIDWQTLKYATSPETHIELRPLKSLSNEELRELALMGGAYRYASFNLSYDFILHKKDGYWHTLKGRTIGFTYFNKLNTDQTDFLRGKGFLMSFRQIPEEVLISLGWAVYRKEGE